MTSCIKLRTGLFLVEWTLPNFQPAEGKISLLFDHGAVSKAYTLKYRIDTKNSLLEITVFPKKPVKNLKRSYHTAFDSSESSSSEDNISMLSSVSDDEEITSDTNQENDASDDEEIVSHLIDVLEYRADGSDEMDELYEPDTGSATSEETESEYHDDELQEPDEDQESGSEEVGEDSTITAQGNNIYNSPFYYLF